MPTKTLCTDEIIGYTISNTRMTWFESQLYCMNTFGTGLATIYNSDWNQRAFNLCNVKCQFVVFLVCFL